MKLGYVGVDLAKNVFQLHGKADPAAIREALREAQLEQCQRYRGDLRGNDPPHTRFVAVKCVEQQDMQATHRIRAEPGASR